jgi:hypothetical protein
MDGFLAQSFTLHNILNQLIWAALWAVLVRGFVWLAKKSIDKRREIAFWVIVPVVVVLFIGTIRFATSQGTGQPILKATIDSVAVGNYKEGTGSTALMVVVAVRNLGMPTIIEGWSLLIDVSGVGKRTLIPEYIPIGKSVTLDYEGGSITFSGAEIIFNKTTENPLLTGAMARGVLIFIVNDIRKETVARPGTTFTLSFTDVTGKAYSVSRIWTGVEGKPPYLPGLHPSSLPDLGPGLGKVIGAPQLPAFLVSTSIKPFIPNDLMARGWRIHCRVCMRPESSPCDPEQRVFSASDPSPKRNDLPDNRMSSLTTARR